MDKPVHRYKEGTLLYRLVTEDWSHCSTAQIAAALFCQPSDVRSLISQIRKDTGGYEVPHIRNASTKDYQPYEPSGTLPDTIRQYQKQNPKIPHTFAYCAKTDCQMKWRAVCWTRCPGFVQKPKEVDSG